MSRWSRRRPRFVATTLAAALLLTACSSSDGEPLDEAAPLPIDALLAPTGGTALTRQQEFDLLQNQIKECMEAEGFVYFPGQIALDVDVESLPSSELRAFADDHGYGLTEILLPRANALDVVAAGVLPSFVSVDLSGLGLPPVDPEMDQNDLYVQTLGADQLDAYYTALEGSPFVDEELGTEGGNLGCMGSGTGTRSPATEAPVWLEEAMFHIDDRVQSAAGEFDEVERRWADCMSAEGFDDFSGRLDAPESIRGSILNLVLELPNAEAELDKAALHQLHQHEMTLAAADAECYSTVYRPGVRGIEHRIQTEVLTELGVIEG